MSLVVLVSFIYIIFFSDDCKYCCIGTGIKYLFIIIYLFMQRDIRQENRMNTLTISERQKMYLSFLDQRRL
jgi:uncharacterized membrane protein YkvI